MPDVCSQAGFYLVLSLPQSSCQAGLTRRLAEEASVFSELPGSAGEHRRYPGTCVLSVEVLGSCAGTRFLLLHYP